MTLFRKYRLLRWASVLVLLYVVDLVCTQTINSYYQQILILTLINAILAVSLNLVNGFNGQFSIGHAGFMAIGGYMSAALTVYFEPAVASLLPFLPASVSGTVWFLLTLLVGGFVSALFGLLVGIPSLRLTGDYLAIVTLGFGEIIRVIILNLDVVGGARGFTNIPEHTTLFWTLFFLILCVIHVHRLVSSSKGKAIVTIRDNELAAASIGINTTRYKTIAFVVGAFYAGIAGSLFAHYVTYLHTNTFTFIKSIEFIAMVVLGGMGSITGSILGASLLTILPEALRAASSYRMIIYSLLLIGFMLWRREGLTGKSEFSPTGMIRWFQLRFGGNK